MWREDPIENKTIEATRRGERVAVVGALLSLAGDALQIIGEAIAAEEAFALETDRRGEIAKLQRQIDELKKRVPAATGDSSIKLDDDTVNRLVGKLMEKLDGESKSNHNS